jgi:hypothetical protein
MSGDHTKYHGTAEVVKDKGEEHMKTCIYVLSIAVIATGIGFYLVHIWTDCLQDHSVLTCMRMLGR